MAALLEAAARYAMNPMVFWRVFVEGLVEPSGSVQGFRVESSVRRRIRMAVSRPAHASEPDQSERGEQGE
jgi:hypothetical protein